MSKCHGSPRDFGKIAILVPPKLSSELELRSTFLGQFWRYSDGIFSKVTRRTVAFSPIIQGDTEEFQKPPVDAYLKVAPIKILPNCGNI